MVGTRSFPSNVILDRVRSNPKYDLQKNIGSKYDYGFARRALNGIPEAVEVLSKSGEDFFIYNPGADSYLDQIWSYSAARNVIAIRGAELANVLWMNPGSKVIEIDNFPGAGINSNPATILGQIM